MHVAEEGLAIVVSVEGREREAFVLRAGVPVKCELPLGARLDLELRHVGEVRLPQIGERNEGVVGEPNDALASIAVVLEASNEVEGFERFEHP